jgi:hypothetical protein
MTSFPSFSCSSIPEQTENDEGCCKRNPEQEDASERLPRTVSFIRLHRRLYLSLFDPIRTSAVALHELNRKFVLVPYNLSCKTAVQQAEMIEKGQVSLAEIYNFDCLMRAVARQNPDSKLIICAGLQPAVRARTVLLLGCHMLMSLGENLETTRRTFVPLSSLPGSPIPEDHPVDNDGNMWSGELTASSCWEALAAAKTNRWIDFDRPFVVGEEILCLEEYLHYSE